MTPEASGWDPLLSNPLDWKISKAGEWSTRLYYRDQNGIVWAMDAKGRDDGWTEWRARPSAVASTAVKATEMYQVGAGRFPVSALTATSEDEDDMTATRKLLADSVDDFVGKKRAFPWWLVLILLLASDKRRRYLASSRARARASLLASWQSRRRKVGGSMETVTLYLRVPRALVERIDAHRSTTGTLWNAPTRQATCIELMTAALDTHDNAAKLAKKPAKKARRR
jgi:hypothetical protein